jgi:hypothetical protein
LRPGCSSTPLDTSTPNGRTRRTAMPTFKGFNPPARITCARSDNSPAASQSVVWPLPLTGPSNRMRPGSTQARCGPGRTTGNTLKVFGRSSFSMSSMSVCRMSGLKSRRISSTCARVG